MITGTLDCMASRGDIPKGSETDGMTYTSVMENILYTIDDLVSISLTFSKDFLFIPGVLYNILRFIAWENINVLDIIFTHSELSLLVSDKDAMRCYKTLGKLVKKSKNNS